MTTLPFTAVIFDLDGVITRTALVHARAWKQMFDHYLKARADRMGEVFTAFDHEQDYLRLVDGKPRYEGVRSFLGSRGICLPEGSPGDAQDQDTICGLGNRKNLVFNKVLEEEGVQVYPATVRLIEELREAGIRVGVASSSRNARMVLEKAGLMPQIETLVDGIVSEQEGLKGKPDPDIFLAACTRLQVIPARAVVVEDASSGVEAGRKGDFGLVIGLAREKNEQELLARGADIVREDLAGITIEFISNWFIYELPGRDWLIHYPSYEPGQEKTRESLLAIGNGYFATRGCHEECKANEWHYPGTYIGGLYNRLVSTIAGKEVENEDLVNCPNWLPVQFSIDGGPFHDLDSWEILQYSRALDLRTGELRRLLVVRDQAGRESRIESTRFAPMQSSFIACLRYAVTPLNYSGEITLRSSIDGTVVNGGVERYKDLNNKHLQLVDRYSNFQFCYLHTRTTESQKHLIVAVKNRLSADGKDPEFPRQHQQMDACVSSEYVVYLKKNKTLTLDKTVMIKAFRHAASGQDGMKMLELVGSLPDIDSLLSTSRDYWKALWEKIGPGKEMGRHARKMLNLHAYHLLVCANPNRMDEDTSVTARGLHGEAYRGHIFWDELFIMPFYTRYFPEVSRNMLNYRYRRLGKARENAAGHGLAGALYPWQSGADGREETQAIHLNPLSGTWNPDHSYLQRHVSLAIGYNILQYAVSSGDTGFMEGQGWEMLVEICRCWVSMCRYNPGSGRYDIHGVMGPDEYHEKYPGAASAGLSNNAYTNLMLAWLLQKVLESERVPKQPGPDPVQGFTDLKAEEIRLWEDISRKLALEINGDGIIAQFQGYFKLKTLDWEKYREKYGNISRLDRILKAEGLEPDGYQLAKQADLLMVFYLLGKEGADQVLARLQYPLPGDYLKRNFDFYYARTSHGSTLSKVVHAKVAALAGLNQLGQALYLEALSSDYLDLQGGTTAEGIHTGLMAATLTCFD